MLTVCVHVLALAVVHCFKGVHKEVHIPGSCFAMYRQPDYITSCSHDLTNCPSSFPAPGWYDPFVCQPQSSTQLPFM